MSNTSFYGKNTHGKSLLYLIFSVSLALVLLVTCDRWGTAFARTDENLWYRLRTNSVPYQPEKIVLDGQGGIWITAVDGTEYEPGVWYMAPDVPEGSFQYITDTERNNKLGTHINMVVKSQLDASVLSAVKDGSGNQWYALKDKGVMCEKTNGTWVAFNPQNTDGKVQDYVNRIRLMGGTNGSQTIALISYKGIALLDSDHNITHSRINYSQYNNDFINDALIDSQGRYWILTGRGVEKGTSLLNTTWVSTEFPDNPSVPGAEKPMTRVIEDTSGNIWFTSNAYGSDGVYCFTHDGQWRKYDLSSVLSISNQIVDMTADNDGIMWFGGLYSGLLRFVPDDENGDWHRYQMGDTGTKSNTITSLIVRNGDLWFATGYNPSVPGNGTGVHHLVWNQQNQPEVVHYTFRENSSTLTSLRINYIAADLSGSVWFPAYDDPSIARLKPDGTWEQFRGDQGNNSLGGFGVTGVAVDSGNLVYFAPQNSKPIAYNATLEQWIDLPDSPFSDFYYYGVYIDANDGKWFHGAFGIYYLDPGNTAWTRFSSEEHSEFPDNYIDRVLVDDSGNAWFTARGGMVLMKKTPEGNDPDWFRFVSGDASGFSGGYAVYQDDKGQIWNGQKQKFDSQENKWGEPSDTSDFDNRHLRFLNGRIPVTMELLENFYPADEASDRRMTMDTRGNLYFCGWLGSVNAGIAVRSPVKGDLDQNGRVDLKDVMLAAKISTKQQILIPDGIIDINGDLKTGIEDLIFMIQSSAQIR